MKRPIKSTDNRDIKKFDIKAWQTSIKESYVVIDPRGNARPIGSKIQGDRYVKGKRGHYVILAKHAMKARRAIEKAGGNSTSRKIQDLMWDLRYEGERPSTSEQLNEGNSYYDLKQQYYELSDNIEYGGIVSTLQDIKKKADTDAFQKIGGIDAEMKIWTAIQKLFNKSKLGKIL